MTITQRRHHLNRLKQKRRRDYCAAGGQSLKRHVTTPKPCSCWICGNPRKFYGNRQDAKTIQEKRAKWAEQSFQAA